MHITNQGQLHSRDWIRSLLILNSQSTYKKKQHADRESMCIFVNIYRLKVNLKEKHTLINLHFDSQQIYKVRGHTVEDKERIQE